MWTRRDEGGLGGEREVNTRGGPGGWRGWDGWAEEGGIVSRLVYFTGYIGVGKEGEVGDPGTRPTRQELSEQEARPPKSSEVWQKGAHSVVVEHS